MGLQWERRVSGRGGRTMELLECLSVPRRRDTRDVIEILVGARIAKPLTRRHLHPRATPHKTQLCPLDPYSTLS